MTTDPNWSLLVVADDPESLDTFRRRFTRRGFSVTAVRQSSAAEAMIRQHEFHVAVLDRTSPGQDGLELMQHLHQIDPQLRVIVLSEHHDASTATRAMDLGAYAYLTKPCRVDELEATTWRACKEHELAEPE